MESRYHFTHQSLLNKELIAGIWHKSDMTCALDSYSQSSLVLCTVACDTAGKDFSSLGYVSLQLVYILIVNYAILVAAEYADFLSSAHTARSSHLSAPLVFQSLLNAIGVVLLYY